jgi:hypothetical protein
LQPDNVRVELVAAWRKEAPSVALRSFLELVNAKAAHIRRKAEHTGRQSDRSEVLERDTPIEEDA